MTTPRRGPTKRGLELSHPPREPRMTAQDVADYAQCSRRHVWNLVKRGKLRPLRNGRLVRFRPEDVRGLFGEGDGTHAT